MHGTTAIRTIGLAAFWATILLSLPLVGGFFGRLHPAFDSLAHFRVHLAVLLVLAALPLLLARAFRWHGLLAAPVRRRRDPDRHRPVVPAGPGPGAGVLPGQGHAEPGLPAAASQSALRQSRAREGAVADRAGPPGRGDAERSIRDVDRKARFALERVSISIRLQGKSPRRRRGDPVAAAVCRGYGGPVPQGRDFRHRHRRSSAADSSRSARCICIGPGRSTRPAQIENASSAARRNG